MARAETASASLRPDSIQGLAKSIAKPAYRRLLSAEPLLRRAVPVLIIAFLSRSASAQPFRYSSSAAKPSSTRDRRSRRWPTISRSRSIIRHETARANSGAHVRQRWSTRYRSGPQAATDRSCVADADGTIIASVPSDPQKLGRPILDLLGPSQPLTTFGAAAGTLEITLPDGAAAFATVRALQNPLGIVAVVQTASTRSPTGARPPR